VKGQRKGRWREKEGREGRGREGKGGARPPYFGLEPDNNLITILVTIGNLI